MRAQNLAGGTFEFEATGASHLRAAQIDHLEGVFIDHLSRLKKDCAAEAPSFANDKEEAEEEAKR